MPTKPLPERPSLAHLRAQASDLLHAQRAGAPDAAQRLREFHPRFRHASDREIAGTNLTHGDALLAIAREYGFASWPRLKAHVDSPGESKRLAPPVHELITDAHFRRAVDLLDAGDERGLRDHLHEHPSVVRDRAHFEGRNYFSHPHLIEFIAENPTRRGRLPANIVEIASIILDAGARDNKESLSEALALVSSSAVARECGVQFALVNALCDAGADPNAAMRPSLMYGEWDAARALIDRGAAIGLEAAAALGLDAEVPRLIENADSEVMLQALALAAQHGHGEIVRHLLDAGVDPNRYNPVGGHSHATPLHEAVISGREDIVRLLLERGARTDLRDIHHDATPADWADHFDRPDLARLLRDAASPP